MCLKFQVWLLATVLLATIRPAQAQPAKKIFRIGYLSAADQATDSDRLERVRRALREFGYIEGQNLTIEYRYEEGRGGRAPALAADLVSLKVDLILCGGDLLIRAVKNATKTIPVVLLGTGSDPVTAGFIESLAHPGGNITGLTVFSRELGGKRLDLLKEIVPKLARVAVIYQPTIPGTAREVKEDLPAAARGLKLSVQPLEVADAARFESAFTALRKERPGALYAPGGGGLMSTNVKRIAEFALKSRLPSMFGARGGVDAGGLVYYGADFEEVDRLVAWYIDKIFKGAKPADIVERIKQLMESK